MHASRGRRSWRLSPISSPRVSWTSPCRTLRPRYGITSASSRDSRRRSRRLLPSESQATHIPDTPVAERRCSLEPFQKSRPTSRRTSPRRFSGPYGISRDTGLGGASPGPQESRVCVRCGGAREEWEPVAEMRREREGDGDEDRPPGAVLADVHKLVLEERARERSG